MTYRIINIATGETWEGTASNAKEAYSHITIKPGDTTFMNYGRNLRLRTVKEW